MQCPLRSCSLSLAATLSPERPATIYILESGLDAATRKAIEQSVQSSPIVVRWVRIASDRLAELQQTLRTFDGISLAAFYRLLLPEVVPSDVGKLIYLDCDLVIRRDISALWQIDVGDALLLAVPELSEAAHLVSSPEGIRLYRDVGLTEREPQFNSGVMLINLRAWRDEHIALRAFSYLRAAGQAVRWYDQEALNVVAAGRWRRLDSRWNVTMHLFRDAANREEAKRLLSDPFIVHFNTVQKPWRAGFPYGFLELFEHHLDATAWSGQRPARTSRVQHWMKRLGRALLKRLDRWVCMLLSLKGRARAFFAFPAVCLDAPPPAATNEMRLFVAGAIGPHTTKRIAQQLAGGADRAIILCSAAEAGLVKPSSSFHRFVMRSDATSTQHEHLVGLLMHYGTGHWCAIMVDNEVCGFPGGERPSLRALRDALESEGAEALLCCTGDVAQMIRAKLFAADPLSGRVMCAPALVDVSNGLIDLPKWRSRIAMVKLRPDMAIGEDLRAVCGAKLASFEGTLQP